MLEEAKGQAVKYLTARMRSEHEMREYLEKKGYSSEIVAEVLAFLYQYQYLNDYEYCRCWIVDRLQFHPCGRQKMAYELLRRGIDNEIVEQALNAHCSAEEERAQAQKLAHKKFPSGAPRQKVGNYLYQKGFSADIIESICSEFVQEEYGQQYE